MSERPRADADPSSRQRGQAQRGSLLLAVLAMTVVVQPPTAHAAHGTHFVDLTGSIRVVDEASWPDSDQATTFVDVESWPDSDQVKSFEFSSYVDLERPDGWQTLLHRDFCAGDEVRVELLVRVGLVRGGLSVHRHATLFEGEDCATTDRDGDDELARPITAFGTRLRLPDSFTVRNTDGGGDHADVSLCVEMDDIPWAQDCGKLLS